MELEVPHVPNEKPPLPQPAADDLDTGMVQDQFHRIAGQAHDAAQPWANKIVDAIAKGAPLRAPSYTGARSSLLTPPKTELDTTMNVDINRTDIGSMLSSMGRGLGYVFEHPVT